MSALPLPQPNKKAWEPPGFFETFLVLPKSAGHTQGFQSCFHDTAHFVGDQKAEQNQ